MQIPSPHPKKVEHGDYRFCLTNIGFGSLTHLLCRSWLFNKFSVKRTLDTVAIGQKINWALSTGEKMMPTCFIFVAWAISWNVKKQEWIPIAIIALQKNVRKKNPEWIQKRHIPENNDLKIVNTSNEKLEWYLIDWWG